MVKREKFPHVIDDAKYLICHHPWPFNANWEFPTDYTRFLHWLACIVGHNVLFAFHYKPSARGTVLIEIDKTCPDFEMLLGEHKWKEMLKNPTEEEKKLEENSSKIFFSIYSSNREAMKDGWRRVHIQQKWFDTWTPDNEFIVQPYPMSHWCPLPQEDQTNKPLTRPLPASIKPPPEADGTPGRPLALNPTAPVWLPPSIRSGIPAPATAPPVRRVWTGAGTNISNAIRPVVPASPPTLPPHLTPSSPAPPGSTSIRTLAKTFAGVSFSADAYEEADSDAEEGIYDGEAVNLWEDNNTRIVQDEPEEVIENLWADVEDPAQPEQVLCPTHGIACKAGICRDMAKLLREKQRTARDKERGAKRKPVAGAGKWRRGAQPAVKKVEGAASASAAETPGASGSGTGSGGKSGGGGGRQGGGGAAGAGGSKGGKGATGGSKGGGGAWGKMKAATLDD